MTGRALQGESSYLEDYTVTVNSDGSEKDTVWTFAYSPVRDEDGSVQGVVCHVHETTSRVRTEERLRSALREIEAQQVRFGTLIEHLPFAAGLFGVDGRALLTNPLCGGFSRAAWRRRSIRTSSPSGPASTRRAGREPVRLSLRAGGEGRGRAGHELSAPVPEGTESWMRVGSIPVREHHGGIRCAIIVMQDVDREKRAEAALRESEERFRRYAEHAANVLWLADWRAASSIISAPPSRRSGACRG